MSSESESFAIQTLTPSRRSQRIMNKSKMSQAKAGQFSQTSTPSKRSQQIMSNTKISYEEGNETSTGSDMFESSSDASNDIYTSADEGEEVLQEDSLSAKVDQVGDGTNDSLIFLSEKDLLQVKENREFRKYSEPRDVYVQPNPEHYFLAGKRVKYKVKKSVAQTKNSLPKKPRKGNRTGKVADENLPERSTSFFSVTAEISKVNLDASLETPMIRKHTEEIEILQQEIKKDFPRWIFILRENFNILLYGYGSKVPILQQFKTFLNEEFLVLDINGLFPKLNARKLLLGFWEALDLDETLPAYGTNILAMAEDMYNILTAIEHPSIFFIVHNLERLASAHTKLFKVICSLSRIKFVHLISTVDNINTGLGFGQSRIVELNLYWINCTTFEPYEEEITWKKFNFNEINEDTTSESSLEQVLKSLTANARKAFEILVTLQLKSMKASSQSKCKDFPGIQFSELGRKCRESFIAHGEMALRTLLTEFVDHKLIRYAGKGKKSDNMLVVDLDIPTLEQISNQR